MTVTPPQTAGTAILEQTVSVAGDGRTADCPERPRTGYPEMDTGREDF